MKRFKHILAPTDLSPESFAAVQYAAHLAQAQGSKLTILHVAQVTTLLFTDFSPPIDLLALDKEIESAARQKLEGWIARHLKADVKPKVLLRSGVTHDVINETAAALEASLVVMATHGRRGLGHALLGSVTERVLREAPCPVLVVRPPVPKAKRKQGR
ncbi:MAG TPA: universal stress protein [Candidatus Binatia bacterium]|nr:universal stress protein [Candidatus Binatia bacterium]